MQILALFLVIVVVAAEVIDIENCEGVDPDKCTIHEIRITPCENKKNCMLTKGANATIALDFTPHFSASELGNSVIYNTIPWPIVGSDACQYTTCPVQAEKLTTYSATMHIGKKLPKGSYRFKWEFHDVANMENQCCFMAKVSLPKK